MCSILFKVAFIIHNLDYYDAMKKRKKQWLRICNEMMSGTLVLLGFTSCDENSTGTGRCEYGTPYAKYEIKGKVADEDR